MRYHGKWTDCIRSASLHRSHIYEHDLTSLPYNNRGVVHTDSEVCNDCSKSPEGAIIQILGELHKGTVSLRYLGRTFNPSFLCCKNMEPGLAAWRSAVEEDIKSIPTFMTFLRV